MKAAEALIQAILKPFACHPLVAPFLGCSRGSPPLHFLHQYELSAMLVPRMPVRAFIGDEIGLGKTISAIAVAKCLERQGRLRRALIVVPRVLMHQWRKELERMGVPEARIRSLERGSIPVLMKKGFPEGYYLASMDLIKREGHVQRVEDAPWDLIIVDEAHRFGHKTKRFKIVGGRLLEANPDRNVLMLSATPHRGNPLDYLARLRLIDPYLVMDKSLDSSFFYGLTHGAIMFRRTKEDVNNVYEGRQVFPPATFYACLVKATEEEAGFVNSTVSFLHSKLISLSYEHGSLEAKALPLLITLVFKRASSSPYALLTTVQRMLAKRATGDPKAAEGLVRAVKSVLGVGYEDYALDKEPDEVLNEFLEQVSPLLSEQDAAELSSLLQRAKAIVEGGGDSKLKALLSLLESVVADGLKAVVFTEYKDTLDYVCSFLARAKPEWRVLRLSSEEASDPEEFRRVREAFELDPEARILIATDVVAEGVNMQVASVVVNYEVPWSVIKLEQRIGRVWRLGQSRSVEAYTFFMDNKADVAALRRMYEKLMNLSAARLKPRAITGEELLLYADASAISGFPPTTVVQAAKHRKGLKVSEHKLILAFLKGDGTLDRMVAAILEAKMRVMREAISKGVLHAPRTRADVERVTSALGFRDQGELLSSFMRLLEAAAPLLGVSLKRRGGELLASRAGGMPFQVKTLDDVFSLLAPGLDRVEQAVLVSLGSTEEQIVIAEARAKVRGALIYSEPVAISLNSGTVYRGAELLRRVSELTSALIGRVEEPVPEVPLNLQAAAVSAVRSALAAVLSPFETYRSRLAIRGLRDGDGWAGLADLSVEVEPRILVKVVPGAYAVSGLNASEEEKEEVERKAIEYVMGYERSQGRIPLDVSAAEHYDVRSVDPSTGEVRYIEVKGHRGPMASAELTVSEAEFAREKGRESWLYIVYDLGSSPKMLTFRDPMNTLAWRLLEKIDRRYVWP